jgi:hypothetical protein
MTKDKALIVWVLFAGVVSYCLILGSCAPKRPKLLRGKRERQPHLSGPGNAGQHIHQDADLGGAALGVLSDGRWLYRAGGDFLRQSDVHRRP